MRIAYIAERFPSDSQTWIHHEIDSLREQGCAVQVFSTWPRPDRIPVEQQGLLGVTRYFPVASLPPVRDLLQVCRVAGLTAAKGSVADCHGCRQRLQVGRDLWASAVLLRAVRDFRPDFIFAHFAGCRTTVALFLSRCLGVPFGFKMHASDIWHRSALLSDKVSSARNLFVISAFGKEFIARNYPDVDSSRFEVHACGLALEQWPFRGRRAMSSTPTIFSVGRLVPMKGFDVLLNAVRLLADRGIEVQLRIAGDGDERFTLEELASRLGVTHLVEFLGYRSPRQVRDAMIASDLFVLPCIRTPSGSQDGIPVALMEAMATGIPVLSTSISGIPELIDHGQSGLLCEAGSPSALADAITEVIRMPNDRLGAMLARARSKIEESHDSHRQTKKLLMALERSLSPQAAASDSSQSTTHSGRQAHPRIHA